ncbi:hypothetical protein RN001_010148 [Aquatica leii]|uniref:Catalase n=1 Tax=Aquatica leii TaxID=1421715 RepID=A0AAN7PW29_9COLE|nr:hypothetical protein RN001_010148 [Aquatica leii]
MADPATNQLVDWHKQNKNTNKVTTAAGCPLAVKDAVLTVGERGPLLLQDAHFLDEMSHFDRERIPERVVHAKGAGAFGYFEVTHDISKYCAAKVFSKIGKKTRIAVRYSTVGGESGSADTVRDPRGFAVKFYTEDGIWDLVGNNTPIFFIRDPVLFPHFIHTQKRNPQTHLKDANMFWDFITLRPETTHQVMFMFSDRGIPNGFTHMNGYGSHTFKMINAEGKSVYCKFHYKTDHGIECIDPVDAAQLASTDPDYGIRDLFNAIAKKKRISYTMSIQVMTPEQAASCKFNPFDLTKVWPHGDYPLITVGTLFINENPVNYFADVEQLAFNPANMVPGIEPSPDKMLLGRLFAYGDTHRHRLGANYLQLPVNSLPAELSDKVCHYQRDGPQAYSNQGSGPNYHPNSFGGPEDDPRAKSLIPPYSLSGIVDRYDTGFKDQDNFSQPRIFYRNVLDADHRERLVANIAGHLKDAVDFIQERAIKNFTQVDEEFGSKLKTALQANRKQQANL